MVKIKRSYVHRNLTHAPRVRGVNKTNNKFYGSRYPGNFVKNAVGRDIYHYKKMPAWLKPLPKTPKLRGGNLKSFDPDFVKKAKNDMANLALQPIRGWLSRYIYARKRFRSMKRVANNTRNIFKSEL